MKHIHLALVVTDLEQSIEDYTHRLGEPPACVVPDTYALWRTPAVNLSISVQPENTRQLRHLCFEDPDAAEMSVTHDSNGVVWEQFSAKQQRQEILSY